MVDSICIVGFGYTNAFEYVEKIEIACGIYARCDHHDCAKWKTAIN